MENTQIRAQVLAIVETFGMKGKVVAKAMGVTESTYNMKKCLRRMAIASMRKTFRTW